MKRFQLIVKNLRDSPTLRKLFLSGELEIEFVSTGFARQRFIKQLWSEERACQVGYTRHFHECHDLQPHGYLCFVTTKNWENEHDRSFSYEHKRIQLEEHESDN
jgi:hypothetical protein